MLRETSRGNSSRGGRAASLPRKGGKAAVKILHERHGRSARDEIAVFESLKAGGTDCRSIIRLYEHFEVEGHACLAFEMHGVSLYDIVEKGPLALAEVKSIARDIAAALKELHALGFAHTDLKSDNILYGGGVAKLIDFSTADDALRKGETFGTREYRAPEAILGGALGPSVDLWSFGCTVFELLTRDYLFDPHGSLWARRQRTGEGQAEWDSMKRAAAAEGDATGERPLFSPGVEIGGKYRLESRLGEGHFSTVWQAKVLRGGTADGSVAGGDFTEKLAEEAMRKVRRAGGQRKTRGAGDEERELACRYDVSLDSELLKLIEGTLGEYPRGRARKGKYYGRFFTKSGRYREGAPGEFMPIREVLVRVYEFDRRSAEEIEQFLLPLLDYDPRRRPTPEEILNDPWLRA